MKTVLFLTFYLVIFNISKVVSYSSRTSSTWSFMSETNSYLLLKDTFSSTTNFRFKFRTYLDSGSLLRANIDKYLTFYLDIVDGRLSFRTAQKYPSFQSLKHKKVNDMRWHSVNLEYDNSGFTVQLDHMVTFFPVSVHLKMGKDKISSGWQQILFGFRNNQISSQSKYISSVDFDSDRRR